jgi:uncharacterized NAD(P)/FAD-binding protein YdhS
VDWLVSARVPLPSVDSSASPLIAAMRASGVIRPYRPVPGRSWDIDVDREQHPLDVDGRPDRQLWVLGTLCEGRTYYTNLVGFRATSAVRSTTPTGASRRWCS